MISQGDSYSTLGSPGHTPEAAVIWAASVGLQQASIPHFRLVTSSLPFEDARGRCLSTLYHEHLQQKCPKLLPRTLPAPPGALFISALLTEELPALRLHRQPYQQSERVKKTAPKSLEKTAACSYRKERAVSPTGSLSELSNYRLK